MVSKEYYLKFMSEVRKVSGVDTLTPDETGLVSIRVDDAYNVNLQFVEATGKILCFVEVTALPPDANGAFGAMMLQANFHLRATEGATLCQNPETQAYALVRPFPLAITDVESLAAGLESLANQTENWRKALAGLNTAEAAKEQSAASTSDGDSHHDMMASGFFHV